MAGKARVEVLNKQLEAANANLVAARLTVDGSGNVLALYRAQAANPLELVAARNAATSQIMVAEMGLAVAQADRAITERGPQAEAVAVAQARVKAAEANLKLVQAQAKRATISSPMTGRVVDRQIHVGETARPGVPLLILADMGELELTVYVPMRLLQSVHLGQAGVVRLPSLAGKKFDARISYIAPEAEFKPANIYNGQDRSEMVFSVRLSVPNASGVLRAGLPADVMLQ